MERVQITHDLLREIIDYDPTTGIFSWTVSRPKVRVGTVAGTFKHHKGYVIIEIYGVPYAAHRLAWFFVTGLWPKEQIDHKNGNKSDNALVNLREATNGQNRANTKQKNKTGFKGVRYHPWLKENPYEAQIKFQKKVMSLGCFPTAELAHEAYKKKAMELHGEFARF